MDGRLSKGLRRPEGKSVNTGRARYTARKEGKMGIFEEFKLNRKDVIECMLMVNYNKKALRSGLITDEEKMSARRIIAKCVTSAESGIGRCLQLIREGVTVEYMQDVMADPDVVKRFCLPGTSPLTICNSIRRLVAKCMEV